MDLLGQLFGSDLPLAVRFLIAFAIVLALIALSAWVIRRVAGRRLPVANASGRARQPRLGVLDAFAIDARRRLVLVRRDNVEHLILIGGPNDVLLESQIVRAPAQPQMAPPRSRPATEPVRGGLNAPAGTPGQITARLGPSLAADEATPPPPPDALPEAATPGRASIFRTAFARPGARNGDVDAPAQAPAAPPAAAPAPARAPRAAEPSAPAPAEPAAAAAAPSASPSPAAKPRAEIDPLYADIERKLEEALQRPASGASAPAPQPNAAKPTPPPYSPAPRRVSEAPAPAAASKDVTSKSHLDALEEEMASLLGRDRSS